MKKLVLYIAGQQKSCQNEVSVFERYRRAECGCPCSTITPELVSRILIPDIPYIHSIPRIRALSNRSCPTGCAHHLVHHHHSALDLVSLHRDQVIGLAYLPPQSLKSLLLRLRIDPGANDKGNDIEERHPGVFW